MHGLFKYEARLVVALYKTYNVLLLQLIQKTIDIFFIVWQLLRARLCVRLDRLPGPVLTSLVWAAWAGERSVQSGPGVRLKWGRLSVPACPASVWYPGELWQTDESRGSKSSDSVLSQTRIKILTMSEACQMDKTINVKTTICMYQRCLKVLSILQSFRLRQFEWNVIQSFDVFPYIIWDYLLLA